VDKIDEAIERALIGGQLPCAVAFRIAESLGVDPGQVGEAADRLDIRLSKCQLGLFGYGPKAEGKHRRVKPLQNVPPELAQAIHTALGPDGKLDCAEAWRISNECHVSKQLLSNAVEALGLRIIRCQLGAF
jgi:hypothetical protein